MRTARIMNRSTNIAGNIMMLGVILCATVVFLLAVTGNLHAQTQEAQVTQDERAQLKAHDAIYKIVDQWMLRAIDCKDRSTLKQSYQQVLAQIQAMGEAKLVPGYVQYLIERADSNITRVLKECERLDGVHADLYAEVDKESKAAAARSHGESGPCACRGRSSGRLRRRPFGQPKTR